MIHMKDIMKVYENGAVALNNVNVDIRKGEFVFLVGPSGAGKSTFIKMLFREVLPTSGILTVNGRDVIRMANRDVPYLRRSLGVIFQDYRLLPDKTVYENIAFAMQVIEAPRRMMQRSVNSVLDIVGLRDKYKCFPNQLSGGEQQRVSIARALAMNPKLLLCDEPNGELDYQTGKQILKLLQDTCREKNMTVIVITHNTAITPMADHVIEIKNGQVGREFYNGNPMPVENIEW
ncbi:MAG: ATP-binding cassette domain-containing protein [Lachnospiraceae bacterium]|nr:ATP-binding cassette domain-containing protein [Lachnospiraceae bacterium]